MTCFWQFLKFVNQILHKNLSRNYYNFYMFDMPKAMLEHYHPF